MSTRFGATSYLPEYLVAAELCLQSPASEPMLGRAALAQQS